MDGKDASSENQPSTVIAQTGKEPSDCRRDRIQFTAFLGTVSVLVPEQLKKTREGSNVQTLY